MVECGCGEQDHLCAMVEDKRMDEVQELAKNATHMCQNCGRASNDEAYLCNPKAL
jgi:hypothetical protein